MRVEIEVVAAPLVNYAMAHNGLGFLHRVTVAFPDSTGPVERVTLTASIRDAEGRVLTRPWSHRVDAVAPGGRIALDSPAIRLDPHQMSTAEEELAAEIVVSVTVGDGEGVGDGEPPAPVESFTPIRVLAARQWLVEPHAVLLSLELLAAFVQPNHPDIDSLLPAIGDRLTRATRSGSLAVADVRPERIDAIVEAVFCTVHDLGISYAEPPAGWGYGQKVRSVSDVLTQRLGTCLDTTLALASVLEHLGIAPVIWIARRHAFLGWWRSSGLGLPDAASLQVATAANAVDLTAMGVLETTLLTRERRPPRDLCRRAVQAPLDGYFRGGTADLVGVVDVAMTQIAERSGLPERSLHYYLQQLGELGYVARRYPLRGAGVPKRTVRYVLEDPLLRFWFRFVFPNLSFIQQGGPRRAFKERIVPGLAAYEGLCFERLCREALPMLYRAEDVAAAFTIGEYWDKHVQIDVVGVRDDGWADLAECRWGTVRSAASLRRELDAKVTAWPNQGGATIQRRLFVRRKPAHAVDTPQERWHDLEDLHAAAKG